MKKMKIGLLILGVLLIAAAAVLAPAGRVGLAGSEATPLAIVDFNYNDSSGEPADQNAVH
jgi:hypothetical protein